MRRSPQGGGHVSDWFLVCTKQDPRPSQQQGVYTVPTALVASRVRWALVSCDLRGWRLEAGQETFCVQHQLVDLLPGATFSNIAPGTSHSSNMLY